MGLTQALATALSGLHATQTGLSIVAGNVANAETPGYVRKTARPGRDSPAATPASACASARSSAQLDQYVQHQLRVENSGGAYADLRAQFYSRLQTSTAQPGSDSALETVYNNFTDALQALSTSPDDTAARSAVHQRGAGAGAAAQRA